MGRLDRSETVSATEIGSYLARSINLFAAGKIDEAIKLRDRARFLMQRESLATESSSDKAVQNEPSSTDFTRTTVHH